MITWHLRGTVHRYAAATAAAVYYCLYVPCAERCWTDGCEAHRAPPTNVRNVRLRRISPLCTVTHFPADGVWLRPVHLVECVCVLAIRLLHLRVAFESARVFRFSVGSSFEWVWVEYGVTRHFGAPSSDRHTDSGWMPSPFKLFFFLFIHFFFHSLVASVCCCRFSTPFREQQSGAKHTHIHGAIPFLLTDFGI